MYLTEDEYKVLLGLKDGLNNTKIKEKYGVQMGMNDPRIISLARKYGIDIYNPEINFRKEIAEKADLSKVQIVSRKEMPYFEYIDLELADYIDINKRDIEVLVKYFKNIPNEDLQHTHRLYQTDDGLGTSLCIKDLKTGEMTRLRMAIDGEDYTENKDWLNQESLETVLILSCIIYFIEKFADVRIKKFVW